MQMRFVIFVLFIWTVLAAMLLPQLAFSQTQTSVQQLKGSDGLLMVTTTGRAVIQHEEASDEARNLALEDALYYAALEGGAQIKGYSAVDETTSLQEMFIVRPAAQILDYTIINEMVDDTHYEVTIQAVIGELSSKGCQNRPVSHVTLFKAKHMLAEDLPYWMSQLPEGLSQQIAISLAEQPRLRVRDARNKTRHQATSIGNVNNQYDYRHLTSGRVSMRDGDVSVETRISFESENKTALFSQTEYTIINIESHLFGMDGDSQPQIIKDSYKIRLGQKTAFYSLDVLSREQREHLVDLIKSAGQTHVEKLTEEILCQPMTARLELADGRLRARLGMRQGLGHNHLAFTQGDDTKFRILRVAELEDSSVVLAPLDSRQNLSDLAGVKVKFLEFN